MGFSLSWISRIDQRNNYSGFCFTIKYVRAWRLEVYMEASNHFLAYQHFDFRKRLWFVMLWLCPGLILRLKITSINVVCLESFSFCVNVLIASLIPKTFKYRRCQKLTHLGNPLSIHYMYLGNNDMYFIFKTCCVIFVLFSTKFL